ncbi:hypothetical protein F4778DRAFT_779975 [Xylariomycetidae sp. FL2044]|nr:hypothetical protein F4778DRAFT_779975 [Xylariomycetidae sp. FL2044]
MSLTNLQFGVEIETMVKVDKLPKDDGFGGFQKVMGPLHDALLQDLEVEMKHPVAPNDYSSWVLTQDISLHPDKGSKRFGAELISPVYTEVERFERDVKKIFRVLLKSKFDCQPSQQCGTHIHVSNAEGSWTLEQVRHIAYGIMIYMPQFMNLEQYLDKDPGARSLAKPNPGLPYGNAYSAPTDYLASCTSIAEIVYAMSPDPAKAHSTSRRYYWNFSRLISSRIPEGNRSLEFRMPPGARDARMVMLWVYFVHIFVLAASDSNLLYDMDRPAKLGDFMNLKACHLGVQDSPYWKAISELLESI